MIDCEAEISDIMINYMCALKILESHLEVINDEFQYKNNYNPIEHIKTRIKSTDSIVKKLQKYGYDFSIENVVKFINDIIGARIVCSFKSNIYELVDIIKKSSVLEVIEEKDYISNPKASGYSSYHLIVLIPVCFSKGLEKVKAEIQIRTIAMDFWASLEHKINYKFSTQVPTQVKQELIESSKLINSIDNRMDYLKRIVNNY